MMPNFRVWDKRLEILRPVASIDFVTKEAFYWIDKSSETCCYFTECILMQSTGLFDKNGKEIYEGDILKTRTRGLVSVRKESGNMMVTYQSGVNTRTSLTLSSFLDRYKFVVIGNIYENPELLEGGK